jgi:phosphatidylserine decarboxylase
MRGVPFVRLDPAGTPFIVGALVIAILAGLLGGRWYGLPFLVSAAFFVFFFRDPERAVVVGQPDAVLSPADGKVMIAGPAVEAAAPAGDWQQISIFLSPMDVHVNRVPISGTVVDVSYKPGRFLAAYKYEAASENERSEIWIDHGGQKIVARQIVGALARRVVCRLEAGAVVKAGDRYGVMKFGSRMDIFVPTTATLKVRPGDRVRGGESVIAMLTAVHPQ